MRFAMMGNSEFTLYSTQALLDSGSNVCAIISMPEESRPNNSADIVLFSKKHGIPHHAIEDINSPESIEVISTYFPDYIFCEWPRMIGEKVLEIPKGYCIGSHPTDLPYNRGRHPLHWCICLGISKTSLSFFRMDKGVDSGEILLQITFSITIENTIDDVNKKMNTAAYEGIKRLYDKLLIDVTYTGTKQNHSAANYWRKRTPHDVTLDPRMSVDLIIRTVRSFTLPYPCANLIFKNKIIKIVSAKRAPVDMSFEQLQRIEPGKRIRSLQHVLNYVLYLSG
jgi:methionyl-tRNA formyltransferase